MLFVNRIANLFFVQKLSFGKRSLKTRLLFYSISFYILRLSFSLSSSVVGLSAFSLSVENFGINV